MTARRITVDIIACDGHGLCADLLPERIGTDDWGYPIVSEKPIPKRALKHARRAVRECPVLALRLEEVRTAGAASGRSTK